MDAPAPLMTTRDALVGVVVGAIHADGRVLRVEIGEAAAHLAAVPALGLSATDVEDRLDEIRARVAAVGAERFLAECVANLPSDLRVRAFRAVADVIASDREIVEREERYLARLATTFRIA